MHLVVLNAQVVINEFSCSNYSLNIGGDNEDFIEFYNSGGADVDLGGYFLSDQSSKRPKSSTNSFSISFTPEGMKL